ncbi:MAG: serine/threonine protein kinase [Deltaproteobacteria bacterium]|nr:serine/threonine protein kinase [Deltaproteobacteria bacterium]
MSRLTPSPSSSPQGSPQALPARFGPYLLLHRIARGGMGDVFLAKTGGSMGIEKHCVVKTLQDSFLEDEHYVARFIEEARLVVQLSHRNICQVFDVGRVGHAYYLAMELVLGRDVRSLQMALFERQVPLPEAVALHVAGELLDALDYAHRHCDPTTGQPLHIVHRDVSPQNVLINFEGEVKLIDFGLAERGRALTSDAVSAGEHTVLGKIAYMAPEHARGEVVDARADQFAIGVMLYELLTAERYYTGRSAEQVWTVVGTGRHEPPRLAQLEPTLQAILRRALDPDKRRRFGTCGELRDELLEFARTREAHAGGRTLRQLMNELFAGDLQATRELLQRAARRSPATLTSAPPEGAGGRVIQSFATLADTTLVPDPTEVIPRTALVLAEAPGRRARTLLLASVATAALLSLVLAVAYVALQPAAPPPRAAAPPPPTPTTAPPTPSMAPTDNALSALPPAPKAAATTKPAGAGADARPRRDPPTPAPPPTMTVARKMAALKQCDAGCAPELRRWEGRLGEHPDIMAFKVALDACFRACSDP